MRPVTALILLGLVAAAVPAAALDIGCVRADDRSASVVAPFAAAVIRWTPECVILPTDSEILFTSFDVIPQGLRLDGCFDTGTLRQGEESRIAFTFDRAIGRVIAIHDGAAEICHDQPSLDGLVELVALDRLRGRVQEVRILIETS